MSAVVPEVCRKKAGGTKSHLSSLRGAERRSNPVSGEVRLDCFAALAMTARCRLLHRRDREFRALLDAGRPARGHRLGLGVEADRVRSVLVEIAEARLLPA